MEISHDSAGMAILEKAGAIVTALEDLGESSVKDIADRVDEPVSSTYRLLATLAAVGWVDSGSRRGLYRLGLDIVRIGGQVEDHLDVRRACLPSLADMRERTGETAFLCVRRGDRGACIERLGGRDVQTLGMRIGDAYRLYMGAAPFAILAFLPDEEREAVLARFGARRDDGHDVPPDGELRRRIEQARSRGYAISDEDVTPGVGAIGAPVFNHRGELEGAISLSGLRDRVLDPATQNIELVLEAALDSSRALGYREGVAA